MITRTGLCAAYLDAILSGRKKLLAAGLGLLVSSCNPEVIPKGQVKSPNGDWVVTTEMESFTGPGNNALFTSAYLSQAILPKKRGLILSLSLQYRGDGDVQVTWLDKTHLELGYRKKAEITFQAVRYAGAVDISVRKLD